MFLSIRFSIFFAFIYLAACKKDCLEENQCKTYPGTCEEATAKTQRNGIFMIQVPSYPYGPFYVQCHQRQIVIQYAPHERAGNVNFNENWKQFKHGFGKLLGTHWLGLEKIYALTLENDYELLIDLLDDSQNARYARYSAFSISNEDEGYAINYLGNYSGNAGDRFSYAKGVPFSTRDKGHENFRRLFANGWWFNGDKTESNLNGALKNKTNGRYQIFWKGFGESNGIISTRMKLKLKSDRPRPFYQNWPRILK